MTTLFFRLVLSAATIGAFGFASPAESNEQVASLEALVKELVAAELRNVKHHQISELTDCDDSRVVVEARRLQSSTIEGRLSTLENALASVDLTASDAGTLVVKGNLQIVNGGGRTTTANGKGNLIVGYNENDDGSLLRTGSHSIIVGAEHEYTSYSGIVSGRNNRVTGIGSAVFGGRDSEASGTYSAVYGGIENAASGTNAAAFGGIRNSASGLHAVVAGGTSNKATSTSGSAVFGGIRNEASGLNSAVVGGDDNVASGRSSVALGGQDNNASGRDSATCGGLDNEVSGRGGVSLGGRNNNAIGEIAAVVGGVSNVASGTSSLVAGGNSNTALETDSVAPFLEPLCIDVPSISFSGVSSFVDTDGSGLFPPSTGDLSIVEQLDPETLPAGVTTYAIKSVCTITSEFSTANPDGTAPTCILEADLVVDNLSGKITAVGSGPDGFSITGGTGDFFGAYGQLDTNASFTATDDQGNLVIGFAAETSLCVLLQD